MREHTGARQSLSDRVTLGWRLEIPFPGIQSAWLHSPTLATTSERDVRSDI